MRTRFVLVFGAVCVLAGVVSARASDLVLEHARVYPSPDAPAMENATVVVHDGRIASVSQPIAGRPVTVPHGATVLDCSGMSVTAGLWNSHVHILPVNLLHGDQKTGAELTLALQEMLTRWGFTTVFDIASVLANTENIRTRIGTGEVLGPRILTVGEPFFPPRGVPIYVQGYLKENAINLPDDPTTEAAVARVRRQIGEGADGVKIFAGSSQKNDVLVMPMERARAIVAEAHRLGRPVFAHPANMAGLEVALESGVDVLAHVTSEDGKPWTPELVERMKAAKMALIPTLTLFDVEAEKEGLPDATRERFIDQAVGRLRAYSDGGGEVLFGTDVGYIYQFDTAEEYTLMQRAGMGFAQVLASLTTNPARRFGFAGHSGRVAAGMDADLAVFASDPAADITAFSRVRFTIRGGKVIYQDSSGQNSSASKPEPMTRDGSGSDDRPAASGTSSEQGGSRVRFRKFEDGCAAELVNSSSK